MIWKLCLWGGISHVMLRLIIPMTHKDIHIQLMIMMVLYYILINNNNNNIVKSWRFYTYRTTSSNEILATRFQFKSIRRWRTLHIFCSCWWRVVTIQFNSIRAAHHPRWWFHSAPVRIRRFKYILFQNLRNERRKRRSRSDLFFQKSGFKYIMKEKEEGTPKQSSNSGEIMILELYSSPWNDNSIPIPILILFRFFQHTHLNAVSDQSHILPVLNARVDLRLLPI